MPHIQAWVSFMSTFPRPIQARASVSSYHLCHSTRWAPTHRGDDNRPKGHKCNYRLSLFPLTPHQLFWTPIHPAAQIPGSLLWGGRNYHSAINLPGHAHLKTNISAVHPRNELKPVIQRNSPPRPVAKRVGHSVAVQATHRSFALTVPHSSSRRSHQSHPGASASNHTSSNEYYSAHPGCPQILTGCSMRLPRTTNRQNFDIRQSENMHINDKV